MEWSPHPNKVRHLRLHAAPPANTHITSSLHLYFLSVVRQIAKIDIVTRKHIEWRQESCYPSEPVFVASPGAVEEDDGEAAGTLLSGLQVYETVKTGSDSRYSPSCRRDLIVRHLSGSQHLSVHARPRRQKLQGDCPSLHPRQRPHGPARTFHPCCCVTANTPAAMTIYHSLMESTFFMISFFVKIVKKKTQQE